MNPKIIFQYKKQVLLAILFSLIISSFSFAVYNIRHNAFNENYDTINWSFESGLSLSEQIVQEQDNIILLTFNHYLLEKATETSRIYRFAGGLYGGASAVRVMYHPVERAVDYFLGLDQGYYTIGIVSNRGEFKLNDDHQGKLNRNQLDLSNIHQGFGEDLAKLNTIQDITNTGYDQIQNLVLVEGNVFWEIRLIYGDTTIFVIYVVDDTIIIRKSNLDQYYSDTGGIVYGPFDEFGKEPTYISVGNQDPIHNLLESLNDFIMEVTLSGE